MFLSIANFIFVAFLGYLIGRWGDNYLNFWIGKDNRLPHHWIYGYMLMIVGSFYFGNNLGWWTFFFGMGLFMSDLKDFLNLKFFAPDGKTKENRKFWHID